MTVPLQISSDQYRWSKFTTSKGEADKMVALMAAMGIKEITCTQSPGFTLWRVRGIGTAQQIADATFEWDNRA